jgi:hypothetical protein
LPFAYSEAVPKALESLFAHPSIQTLLNEIGLEENFLGTFNDK